MNETLFSVEQANEDVLRHLLDIEDRAAGLVDDAQAEADRRLKECEEAGRARYDEGYRLLAEKLDAEYRERMAAVRVEYGKGLEEYRAGLSAMPLMGKDFSTLAFKLLFGEN